MSNSVTNTKLTNGGGQSQGGGQTARNGSNQAAPVTVSAGQGREIFNQVNVSLGANLRNSDLLRGREKSARNNNGSEGEKTDWKAIKQGTDSAKTSKNQGTDSPKMSKNSHGDDAKLNNSHVLEPKEQTRSNGAEKSNKGQPAAKPNDRNNDSATKGSNQTATQNNENRGGKTNNQPRVETSNNEKNGGNQNPSSRGGGNSAKPSNETNSSNNNRSGNNETNRSNVEINYRGSESQAQSNKEQDATNSSPTSKLNRGQEHGENEQGRGNSKQTNPSSVKTPLNNPNAANNSPNNPNAANAPKNAAENTPPFNNRNQPTAGDTPGRNAPNMTAPQTRQLNLTVVNAAARSNSENNSSLQGNRQNRLLGEVISQVFRENDVYLSRNAVDNLVEHRGASTSNRSGNPASDLLPKEILQLVRAIENQVLQNPGERQIDNKSAASQVNIRISPELDSQIQAAKNLFTQIFGTADAKHFSRLNIQERMLAAIEMFLGNLPAGMPEDLQNNSPEKVFAGFLLARGLVSSESGHSTENLIAMMQSAAGDKVSLAAMRDFGGLVKVLISDAAASKSTANLETAVEKFARILVAINCLDTVLTAVKLASRSQFAGGNIGRTLAITQVYELINRLVLAGQKAMNEAAEIAQKNAGFKGESDKNSRNIFPAKTVEDLSETGAANRKTVESKTTNNKTADAKNIQAENALRNYLEFNPLMANDKFVSAFENSDDARRAQNDFLNRHQIEIEQWLRGGNHRLVKDIDFEKPLGIVVERDKNDFFSATTARIVLVRDGSAQGWHFLKSFLVA